jgi:large conductance mechanosensitive channel
VEALEDEMRSLADEFKTFLFRGNLVELAVAVVIGLAFTAVVTAVVEDIVTPLIAAIFGKPDFSALTFTINGSVFKYGDFINKVINFVTVAAVIFFLIIKPMNVLMARMRKEPPPDDSLRKCPACTEAISSAARRCKYCTTEVEPTLATA